MVRRVSASIVIPTTMRRETVAPVVEAALRSVAALPGAEIIVVANGPSDGRRPLEIRSPSLRVLECQVPRTAAARNLGLREAANEAIIFTDDDCLISAEWVERVARRLHGGEASVATPLKMRRDGPVTSFLDYQRIFDPRPIDTDTVHFAIGASIAIRRDLIPGGFDEDLTAGDDVLFGASLLDAGIRTAYEADAPPPLHVVPERLESVTERFFRYGRSNAQVLFQKDRTQSSIPYAPRTYASLCRNQLTTPRRFEEIADQRVRDAFATLDLAVVACVLAGYLEAAGEALDRPLIRLDRQQFEDGWLEVERRLDQDFAWDGDWERIPVDYGRWLSPQPTSAPRLSAAIADHLNRTAPLAEQAESDPDLDRGGEEVQRRADQIWTAVNELWSEIRAGRMTASGDAVAARMRENGIAFREGMQTMEAIALGAIQPA
jgi:glycosyltransferase involved in cell wall biosynthesis